MGDNIITRWKNRAEEKKKANEKARELTEEERKEKMARIGEAILNMKQTQAIHKNRLLNELEITRRDLRRAPGDRALKARHIMKIKAWYAYYAYAGMMLDQLEMKNDQLLIEKEMSEFAGIMQIAGALSREITGDMPNTGDIIRQIEQGLKGENKELGAIDQLLQSLNKAQASSELISGCDDSFIEKLISGEIDVDGGIETLQMETGGQPVPPQTAGQNPPQEESELDRLLRQNNIT